MTELSARKSSASETDLELAAGEVALWFQVIDSKSDSDTFIRSLLSRYTGARPSTLELARGEHGKPFLVNSVKNLHFSLSHSGDWMVFAVARDLELGVDLEFHDLRREVAPLARRFFTEVEYRDLLALEGEARSRRFYDLWSLREARVKALGSTLGREMERVAFRVSDADSVPRLTVQPGSEDAIYCLYSSLPGYSLALCILSALQRPLLVSLQEMSDSGGTRPVPGYLLASSVA